ncbi:hypothetical protein EDI_045850 [Entamoeba dispar SAW760]|uniref:Ras-GEF domain-containing protein n=1 Tax=Entamoeba dispar (strain ATCC PRA-260 / SAW760) TaxID=370354 RepID=B0EE25_ENTDS|nr:uncharacterized protein EDI_045850 [Entamoeba dispar SAW760]EDR27211.1 hypothetical protein EDI_045850 [Entamoeba dispar SAW760]|eukprot:EDR27211.1 hypothetical protein EDI_045850 [Entamoeba dispar SAW760]
MRQTIHLPTNSSKKYTCFNPNIVSVKGVIIPDKITTEFISFRAFDISNQRNSVKDSLPSSISSVNEFDTIEDFGSINAEVDSCIKRNIPFYNTLAKSHRKESKRYSQELQQMMIGSGIIPTYDFTAPLCCSILNIVETVSYKDVLDALDNHNQLNENFNLLRANKFQTIICEGLPSHQRIALSLVLLIMTSSSVFKLFQVVKFNKTGFSYEDIHLLQGIVLNLAKPLKQMFRLFSRISQMSKEMAIVFSGFLVSDENAIGIPNKLGYRLIQIAIRYEDYVLRGTDKTGVYDIIDSNIRIALCLNIKKLSALLFSKDAIEFGYVRFYMITLPYFTTPATVLHFICDNNYLKRTHLKGIYETVCFEFIKFWHHALPLNEISQIDIAFKNTIETIDKYYHIANSFEEQITALMYDKLKKLTIMEIIETTENELEKVSSNFNKWVKNILIEKQDYQKMLKYANTFLSLKNYDCAYSIYCGLKSYCWINEKKREKCIKVIEKNDTFKTLNKLFNLTTQCNVYKDLILHTEPPFIPIVVLIKQELIKINDIPTFMDNDKRLIRIEGKLRIVYTCINLFIRGCSHNYNFYIQNNNEVLKVLHSFD